MKIKKFVLIAFFTLFIFFSFYSAYAFIQLAKKNQTWPFGSGISKYLPNYFKKIGHEISQENDSEIISQYYTLKKNLYPIPSNNAIGIGGGINIIDDTYILNTLNNGELITFNLKKKSFSKINKTLKDKYLSIRDVELIKKDKKILFLSLKKNNQCMSLVLDQFDYIFEKDNFEVKNYKNIWESSNVCETWDGFEGSSGGRVISHNGHYFISTGFFDKVESGISKNSQSQNSDFGKILKISPFGDSEIFSLGHRNPQGLFLFGDKKIIISTEHGPSGGDEINIIEKNNNYGWPCESFGNLYSYDKKNDISNMWPENLKKFNCDSSATFKKPLFTWTPSIAISQGEEYNKNYFEKFKNNLIVGSLGGMSLFRLYLSEDNNIINEERIMIDERVRDLVISNDGKIIVYTDSGNLMELSKVEFNN
tara:strand:- start:336 stop:1601 length:1266 start_codon:yes stop_codon:yes gene_type:complete